MVRSSVRRSSLGKNSTGVSIGAPAALTVANCAIRPARMSSRASSGSASVSFIALASGAEEPLHVAVEVLHADLLPSILELAGVPAPAGLDGEAILGSAGARPGREVVSHLAHDGREVAAVTDGRWAFIHNLAAPEGFESAYEIYDLREDSLERRNLAGRDAVLMGYAMQRLGEVPAAARAPGAVVDPRALERLRALGYVAR